MCACGGGSLLLLAHASERDGTFMQTRVMAAYFRELRKGYRHTQQSLADAAGIGKRTVERLDRGDRPVSIRSLEPIIATLGASPDEVHYLRTNPSATVSEAKELAQAQLQRSPLWRGIAHQAHGAHQDPRLRGVQIYVRIVRERQNISRKVLADMLGVGMTDLAAWEDGRSNTLSFSVVVRAITQLNGTLEDLKQIDSASEGHEALGRRLAEARVPILVEERPSDSGAATDTPTALSQHETVLRRIAALESIIPFILSLLKRILPAEAPDIERIASQWFQ
jgi:transcriptional regulator with XRE-family HTH domain